MSWFRRMFSRRRLYDDLSTELRQHLDEKVETLVARGLSREDAERAARREFGNLTLTEEQGRDVWRWTRTENVLMDVRYALRQLRRQPAFSVVAVLILGLGIGANAAVYSVADTLLLEPLPFRDADRLAWIINRDTPGLSGRTSTVATYEALTAAQSFEDMSTYEAFFARSSYKLAGDGPSDRVVGVLVPAGFFPFLGVAPVLGRTFTAEECLPNGPGAVLLSHGLWERRYGADPTVVGTTLRVNDRAATIVGVMPRDFDFGAVFAPGIDVEVFTPAVLDIVRNWGNTMAIIGRLRENVSLSTAQAEVTGIIERQQQERPELGTGYGAIVQPLRETVTGRTRQPLLTLWLAVGMVLLIVCVNLSNLLLARGAARRREVALRGALGAGRGRLVQQLLTENLVLAGFGAALGIAFAYAAVAYVRTLDSLSVPLLKTVALNPTVLGVALGAAVLTALLFGLAPAIAVARGRVGAVLKDGGRGPGGSDHHAIRSTLVVAEVALACMLLVGAGLVVRSFAQVLDVDLGFRADETHALRIDAGADIATQQQFNTYIVDLVDAARATPGVVSASVTDAVPLDSNRSWTVRAGDRPDGERVGALIKVAGSRVFETMGTRLIAGREFSDRDAGDSPAVSIINQTLANRLWPGEDPLGRTMLVFSTETEVVGVVEDVRHLTVEASSGPEFYRPMLQQQTASPSLIVRLGRPLEEVAPRLRAALAEVVPDLPTAAFTPLQALVDRSVSGRRFVARLLGGFASVALALAVIGIYGVISYSVTRRTPEIGLRMALGASRGQIQTSIALDTLWLAVIGAALGIAGAVALSSLLSSMLFGVSASDPWTYAVAAAILLAAAMAAGLLPAFRASRVSPMTALRAD